MPSVAPDWVVSRDGSAHEVLCADGTWGPMDQAQWFASYEDARAASTPAGSTGTPRQQHPDGHD